MIRARWLALSLATASSIHATGAEADAPLSVRVTALRSERGRVGCALYRSSRGFPTEPTAAAQLRWCSIAQGGALCSFGEQAAGTYAIACFHDENGNGALDRGLFGIPVEGTVVSNHARGVLGPPSYADARFTLGERGAALSLRMGY